MSGRIVFALTSDLRDCLVTIARQPAAWPTFKPATIRALVDGGYLSDGADRGLTALGEAAAQLADALLTIEPAPGRPVVFTLTEAQCRFLDGLLSSPAAVAVLSLRIVASLARRRLVTLSPLPTLTPVGNAAAALATLLCKAKAAPAPTGDPTVSSHGSAPTPIPVT